jgi:hypothetical protein
MRRKKRVQLRCPGHLFNGELCTRRSSVRGKYVRGQKCPQNKCVVLSADKIVHGKYVRGKYVRGQNCPQINVASYPRTKLSANKCVVLSADKIVHGKYDRGKSVRKINVSSYPRTKLSMGNLSTNVKPA